MQHKSWMQHSLIVYWECLCSVDPPGCSLCSQQCRGNRRMDHFIGASVQCGVKHTPSDITRNVLLCGWNFKMLEVHGVHPPLPSLKFLSSPEDQGQSCPSVAGEKLDGPGWHWRNIEHAPYLPFRTAQAFARQWFWAGFLSFLCHFVEVLKNSPKRKDGTIPHVIMEVENRYMSKRLSCFLCCRVKFHFRDYGRYDRRRIESRPSQMHQLFSIRVGFCNIQIYGASFSNHEMFNQNSGKL